MTDGREASEVLMRPRFKPRIPDLENQNNMKVIIPGDMREILKRLSIIYITLLFNGLYKSFKKIVVLVY